MNVRTRLFFRLLFSDLVYHGATRAFKEYARELCQRTGIGKDLVAATTKLKHLVYSHRDDLPAILKQEFPSASDSVFQFLRSRKSLRGSLDRATPFHDEIDAVRIPTKEEPETPEENTEDFLKWLRHFAERVDLENAETPEASNVKHIFLPVTSPIGIVFSADWHLGSVGIDYRCFMSDTQFLLSHPNELKVITVGDLVDNFVNFFSAEAVLQQIGRPEIQMNILERIAKALARNEQYLAASWGNHDVTRDMHALGQSRVQRILRKFTHFFDGQGIVVLHVGADPATAEIYTILLNHKPPGRSIHNPNYGGKKLYNKTFPADVIVTAHLHKPSWSVDSHYEYARELGFNFGGKRICIACGTYKTSDSYTRRFWTEGRIGAPTVLFWPDCHQMEVFGSAEKAMVYREGLKTFTLREANDLGIRL